MRLGGLYPHHPQQHWAAAGTLQAEEEAEEEEDDAEYEWKSKHELRREEAPLLFFPSALAARVFFVGRAVRVLDKTKGFGSSSSQADGRQAGRAVDGGR